MLGNNKYQIYPTKILDGSEHITIRVCVTSQNRTTLLNLLEETVNSNMVGYNLVYHCIIILTSHQSRAERHTSGYSEPWYLVIMYTILIIWKIIMIEVQHKHTITTIDWHAVIAKVCISGCRHVSSGMRLTCDGDGSQLSAHIVHETGWHSRHMVATFSFSTYEQNHNYCHQHWPSLELCSYHDIDKKGSTVLNSLRIID